MNHTYNYDEASEAGDFIRKFTGGNSIRTAIISGSGLGDIADIITDKVTIDVHEIPHWPSSTAPGHSGKLIIGKISGRPVLLQQGRIHPYEGYSLKAVTFPVRVFGMLGVKEYVATNASGAVNPSYSPGEIIAVKDHINLMGTNPLIGPNESRWNERFPDMSHAYDPELVAFLEGLGLKTGVYAAFIGPSFETPAEVRMARLLGADVIGMSTVPEVITANAMGMRVCVLSCAANMAAGLEVEKSLTGQEVLDKMSETSEALSAIIAKLMDRLNQE